MKIIEWCISLKQWLVKLSSPWIVGAPADVLVSACGRILVHPGGTVPAWHRVTWVANDTV